MGKVILLHANCRNPTARGDFTFAGNIAKDLVAEIQNREIADLDVILVSPLNSIFRFENIYGKGINGRICIEGRNIGLSSLETFDAIDNTVVAFIDANRCKHSADYLIKQVLSPDTKFLFIGNVNQPANSDLYTKRLYQMMVKRSQPGLYDVFSDEDMMIGSAGFGADRLGLATISDAEDLPLLSESERVKIPCTNYGFMYMSAINPSVDYKLIAQYIKLSGHNDYLLVGDFAHKSWDIRYAFENDRTMPCTLSFPHIDYRNSLPYGVMRQTVKQAHGNLVLSTGINSVLEAMQDKKLTYYQNLRNNTEFVNAYLITLKAFVLNDTTLIGTMPQMIFELSDLLFADKPLNRIQMSRAKELLDISSVNTRLIQANQAIIKKANGTIATRLLNFLGEPRKTGDQVQLEKVCASLRKTGELNSPCPGRALRRAASWGRLFELKVLIKSISKEELVQTDPIYQRTALHWAVFSKNIDCVRALVNAGISLDLQDSNGQTAMHRAIEDGDRQMIKIFLEAGATMNPQANPECAPENCTIDTDILLFIQECQEHLGKRAFQPK